jgi:2-furoate---CoA ligase
VICPLTMRAFGSCTDFPSDDARRAHACARGVSAWRRGSSDVRTAERVTNLYLVPTLYHDLVSHPDFAAADTGSVRKVGFAGAAMPDGLLKRVETAFQPELFVNHYGSTEIYHLHDRAAVGGEAELGRQGGDQPAHPSRQARRRSPGRNRRVQRGGRGHRRYGRRRGVRGLLAAARCRCQSRAPGLVFHRDTGYVDAAGDLFVTGRVDDMIISGGESISPAEIESVLSLHPAVAEVAVAGLPDERGVSASPPS